MAVERDLRARLGMDIALGDRDPPKKNRRTRLVLGDFELLASP